MASSNHQHTMKDIATEIIRDSIHSIIHSTILDQHRKHKKMVAHLDPETRLPHCGTCRLPRQIDPPLAPKVRGVATDPPSDTVYCDKKPWCRKPGHDIYGNPFPKSDVTGRPPTKKEREAAAAKNKRENNEGTPASNEGGDGGNGGANDGTAPPSPSADGMDAPAKGGEKLEKGEKKASKIDEKLKKGEYVPWQTCPSCKRSLLITRFAKHLEQCMGLSGRAASRNAMAKMNGSTGANSTPAGSRGGTPGPDMGGRERDGGGGGEDEDEDERIKGPGGVRKKVLKKGLTSKIRKDKSLGGSTTPTTGANGKLPKSLASKRPPPPPPSSSPLSATGDSKRDRDEMLGDDGGGAGDDDEEVVHVKKRQKLQRVESAASLASTAAGGGGGGGGGDVEMERAESNDGSFVDDGGSFGED